MVLCYITLCLNWSKKKLRVKKKFKKKIQWLKLQVNEQERHVWPIWLKKTQFYQSFFTKYTATIIFFSNILFQLFHIRLILVRGMFPPSSVTCLQPSTQHPEQTGRGQALQCSVWAERHLGRWHKEAVEERESEPKALQASWTWHWETSSWTRLGLTVFTK